MALVLTETATSKITTNIHQSKDKSKFVDITSLILNHILSFCSKDPPSNVTILEEFYGKIIPSIDIENYLKRISKVITESDEIFIATLIYLDRLFAKTKILLSPYNIHR